MWRRGDEVFAEVTLSQRRRRVNGRVRRPPGAAGRSACTLWCSAATRSICSSRARRRLVLVPFSWQSVSLHAAGASAVRARIAPSGPSSVSIDLADGLGLPVLSVASMVARPVSAQQLAGRGRAACSGRTGSSRWSGRRTLDDRGAAAAAGDEVPECSSLSHGDSAGGDVYAATHAGAGSAADPGSSAHDSGVAGGGDPWRVALPGEDVTDLAGAAVWGLVRSAQTEHPGRIVLVDSDAPHRRCDVAAVLAAGEPQVVLRDGEPFTPRGCMAAERSSGPAGAAG